jgi:hypothetical protein
LDHRRRYRQPVHDNIAEVFNIAQPGNLVNNNTVANVCR